LVWKTLTEGLEEAMRSAGIWTPERAARIEFAIPRDPAHGDWTTNLAMLLARELKRPPRPLAEALAAAFPRDPEVFERVDVAGAGFVNFTYAEAFLRRLPERVVEAGPTFGHSAAADGTRVLVEYVSANPTGPLNVVNARAAAVGATLVRLLRATGHDAEGEFYVNDAGAQVDLLGASLAARFAQRLGVDRAVPEGGYQGEYLIDIAARLPEAEARRALDDPGATAWFRDRALDLMLEWQKHDLSDYGAEFATWFRESALHGSTAVGDTLAALDRRGMTYRATAPETDHTGGVRKDRPHEDPEDAGPAGEATYLRTTRFGDDVDRVVMRSNGTPTYLLPDVAYHRDKRARGFRHAIDLWGPDHHGYVPRMKAALQALGLEADFLEVIIVQQVNLLSKGQPVKMSKRAGEFVTLRDLMDDVGADCAKFFFLMRSTSSHLDFDLDLARSQNDENPAYYVQYAHARIASVLRFAEAQGRRGGSATVEYDAPEEQLLLRRIAAWPEVVRGAALAREPHRVPTFLIELAGLFHRFYHACRVVSDDDARTRARLRLCEAARIVVRNGLDLMAVSAPERMERTAEAAP
jgi:arginyl-tRNA synthetase